MESTAWSPPWDRVSGSSPLVATALHTGSDVRPGLERFLAADEAARRAARDPFAARWAGALVNRVIVRRSRYEIDLDQTRDRAIPVDLEEPAGRPIWRDPPPRAYYEETLALYDRFYDDVAGLLRVVLSRFGSVTLLDLRCRKVEETRGARVWLSTPTPGERHCEAAISTLAHALRDALGPLAPVARPRVRQDGAFLPWVAHRFEPHLHVVSVHLDAPTAPGLEPSPMLGRAVELALRSSVPRLDTGPRERLLRGVAGR